MLPSLRPGDCLTIQNSRFEETAVGDIVFYIRDGRPYVHRVVRTSANCLVTRGDALPNDDPPLLPDQALGRVTEVCRGELSFALPATLSLSERVLSFIFRHSHWASRIALRWYGWKWRHGKHKKTGAA